jgi:hypothetical protein
MKKRFVLGMLSAALMFGLEGCMLLGSIDGGRYSPNSPPENDCVLTIKGNGNALHAVVITSFDGKTVEWRGQAAIPVPKDFKIKIPAGKHTLTGQQGYGALAGASFSTTFTFVAGKKYEAEIVGSLRIIEK